MKKSCIISLLLAVMTVPVLSSCEKLVFEDRSVCPAFLFFDITNADHFDIADYVHVAAFVYPEDELLNKDTTTVHAIQDKEFSLAVKRSDSVYGYGVTGFKWCHLVDETDWVVDEGLNYDPIWRFDYRTTAVGERFFIPVEMVKDHSNISVFFVDYDRFPDTDGLFPYDIVIKSNTNGINALTGEPVKGRFWYRPNEAPGGTFKFCVPRQYDRSLVFQVWEKGALDEGVDFDDDGNPKMIAEFNVWNWAKANEDFSWTAKNLADMDITIELTSMKVEVKVMPWEGDQGGYGYEF